MPLSDIHKLVTSYEFSVKRSKWLLLIFGSVVLPRIIESIMLRLHFKIGVGRTWESAVRLGR